MSRIIGRPIKKGDPCEAKWLQDGISPNFEAGTFFYDEELKKSVRELPERYRVEQLGQAPMYISDVMEPYYHPAAQKVVESRSELKELDEQYGTVTTNKLLPPSDAKKKEAAKKRKELRMEAMKEAVERVRAGTTNHTDDFKQLCKKRDEAISKQTGIDFNKVFGIKK